MKLSKTDRDLQYEHRRRRVVDVLTHPKLVAECEDSDRLRRQIVGPCLYLLLLSIHRSPLRLALWVVRETITNRLMWWRAGARLWWWRARGLTPDEIDRRLGL